MQISDPQGAWLINTGLHQIHDPESSTVFYPGVLTKATYTNWVKGQPTITQQPDPLAPPAPVEPPAKAPVKANTKP